MKQKRIVVLSVLLLAVILITLDFRNFSPLERAKDTIVDGLNPIRNGAAFVLNPIGDAWGAVWRYDDLREENESLKDELEGFRAADSADLSASVRLAQLLEENELTNTEKIPRIPARILQYPGNFESPYIVLDKGAEAGIKEGMPVVSGAGLVGRITKVSANRSEVTLITMPSARTGIRVVNSGEIFLARGSGNNRNLEFTADLSAEIKEGDLIVTSGLSTSIYPPDIIVGEVSRVQENDAVLGKDIEISIPQDLSKLYFLSVLMFQQ